MSELHIAVTKGKGTVTVDTEKVPDAYYKAALATGFKTLINGGTTKITKELIPDEDTRHHEAMRVAQQRVDDMMAGKLKLTARASTGATNSAVMTEARRIAKALVKDTLKASGAKVSHYSASDILAAANAVIENDPSIITMAEANLAKRAPVNINIADLLQPDATLVAKSEEKVAKAKAAKASAPSIGAIMSKTQAGKVAARHTAH